MTSQDSSLQLLLTEAWRKVSAVLRAALGDELWQGLAAPLEPLDLRRGEVVLQAPSPGHAEEVRRRLGNRLEGYFSQVLGVPIRVRILPGGPAQGLPRPGTAELKELLPHEGNRLAVRALESLRDHPDDSRFTPLLLWGRGGVGKSYLVRSILLGPGTEGGLYATAETFLEDLALARRRQGGVARFRERMLRSRLLVVDEVHRLRDKPAAQAELVYLAKILISRQARVVFVSRYMPREIRRLDRSLLSMLLAGMVVEVRVPGEPARREILAALERAAGPPASAQVLLDALAASLRVGFGPLREAWLGLRQAGVAPATPGEAAELVARLAAGQDTLDRLLRRVAAHFGLEPADLVSERRVRNLSYARQVAAYVAVERGFSLAAVGQRLGGRTRSTVSYMRAQIERARRLDPALERLLEDLA